MIRKHFAYVAAVMLTNSCATLEYEIVRTGGADSPPKEIRLNSSLGGADIAEVGRLYNRLLELDVPIIWDGPMVSADAYYAPAAVEASGGCFTRKASWHPHAASVMGIVPYPAATEWLCEKILPQPFMEVFYGTWHYYDYVTIPIYNYDDLVRIWPQYACAEE